MSGTGVHPWQALLHLLFAGIFGLVLPFVCWGAQATPGHPHARAHFVFWPPTLAFAQQQSATSSDLALIMQTAVICGMPAATGASAVTGAAMPTGVATPSVLAIFLLLALYFAFIFTPYNDAPGFVRRQASPLRRWFAIICEPPPPRPETVAP